MTLSKAILVMGLLFSIPGMAQEQQTTSKLVAKMGKDFVTNTAKVNGTTIHYVRGGNGPAVILVHGYPFDWYAYHRVMPLLAKKFTVIAVDLRGVGGSAATMGGYDSPNLAEDIHQLAQQLKLENVYIVGHDIGGMVAYAFARLYPKSTRGVMVLDVPLPGVGPWEESIDGPDFWHIPFHQIPKLPETLVAGRQLEYFHFMLDPFKVSDAEIAHYAASYGSPEQLRAGFELYRAFPANGKFNEAQRSSFEIPLVWAAGENSFFAKIRDGMAEGFRALGCKNVKTEIIPGSDHFIAHAQPRKLAELIERNASL